MICLEVIGLGELLSTSFEEYKNHFWLFIKVSILLYLIPTLIFGGIALYFSLGNPENYILINTLDILNSLINWIFGLLLTFTVIKILLIKRTTQDEMGAIEAIIKGKEHFGEGICLSLLVTFVIFGPLFFLMFFLGAMMVILSSNWLIIELFLILLLIWFIFFLILLVYWMFSLYALITDDTGIFKSLGHSYSVVKGRWWLVFAYSIVMVIIIILLYCIILLPFYLSGLIFGIMLNNLFITGFMAFIPEALLTMFVTPFILTFMEKLYLSLKEKTVFDDSR